MAGRARARRRTQVQQRPDRPEPPTWIWQFRPSDWPLKDGSVDAAGTTDWISRYCKTRRLWRAACSKWLTDNDLVMWDHGLDMKYAEYKRICEEEPHRVLRRPPRT